MTRTRCTGRNKSKWEKIGGIFGQLAGVPHDRFYFLTGFFSFSITRWMMLCLETPLREESAALLVLSV